MKVTANNLFFTGRMETHLVPLLKEIPGTIIGAAMGGYGFNNRGYTTSEIYFVDKSTVYLLELEDGWRPWSPSRTPIPRKAGRIHQVDRIDANDYRNRRRLHAIVDEEIQTVSLSGGFRTPTNQEAREMILANLAEKFPDFTIESE